MEVTALRMVRITVIESSNAGVRLRVEGRLTGRGVEELRQSCELHALDGKARLSVDLADVSFADENGIELLRDLQARNVAILNLAPFLAMKLRNAESTNPPRKNGAEKSDRKG